VDGCTFCEHVGGKLWATALKTSTMSHRHLLTLLGLVLIGIGLFERGWLLLVVRLGCDFLALGIAHARGAHRIFGKWPDGSLPVWSSLAFLPLLHKILSLLVLPSVISPLSPCRQAVNNPQLPVSPKQ